MANEGKEQGMRARTRSKRSGGTTRWAPLLPTSYCPCQAQQGGQQQGWHTQGCACHHTCCWASTEQHSTRCIRCIPPTTTSHWWHNSRSSLTTLSSCWTTDWEEKLRQLQQQHTLLPLSTSHLPLWPLLSLPCMTCCTTMGLMHTESHTLTLLLLNAHWQDWEGTGWVHLHSHNPRHSELPTITVETYPYPLYNPEPTNNVVWIWYIQHLQQPLTVWILLPSEIEFHPDSVAAQLGYTTEGLVDILAKQER